MTSARWQSSKILLQASKESLKHWNTLRVADAASLSQKKELRQCVCTSLDIGKISCIIVLISTGVDGFEIAED